MFSLQPFSFRLPSTLKRGWGLPLCVGIELVCLGALFHLHDSGLGVARLWFVCLFGLAALGAWYFCLRDFRWIQNTPTSRIASAAQGFVELQGRGLPLDGTPLVSPMNGLPVLWYRYQIEERDSDNKWHTTHEEESEFSFQLHDGSGTCIIDPVGAQLIVTKRDEETRGDTRHTQWSLVKHSTIYVLGYLTSATPVPLATQEKNALNTLLHTWKQQPAQLLKRFDLDQNGELDMREWGLARQAALRQVRQELQQQQAAASTPLPVVQRPPAHANSGIFLISDLDAAKLMRRYRWQSLLHIAGFLAACGLAAFLFTVH